MAKESIVSNYRAHPEELATACDFLATIPYFPNESRAAVMSALRDMAPTPEALNWTVKQAVAHWDKWEGLKELRGILCSRFDAADGIDAWSSHPQFSAEAGEQKSIEKHNQLRASEHKALAPEAAQMLRQITGPAPRQVKRSA
jgi:hypothetical protein